MTSATRIIADQYSPIDPFGCWNVAELHIYLSRAQAKVDVLEDTIADLQARPASKPGGPNQEKAAQARVRYQRTKQFMQFRYEPCGREVFETFTSVTIEPCHICGRVQERMMLAQGLWRCEGGCQP